MSTRLIADCAGLLGRLSVVVNVEAPPACEGLLLKPSVGSSVRPAQLLIERVLESLAVLELPA